MAEFKQPESIMDKGTMIAKIIRNQDWPENLQFYSDPGDFLQIATWQYPAGKHLKAHSHRVVERSSNRTCESLYIKHGRVTMYLYSEEDQLLGQWMLSMGDIVSIYGGGHAYDILEDGTQVLEIKNGPYPGLEADKKLIEQ